MIRACVRCVVLLFAVLAFAAMPPLAASAHISDHGKTVFFHNVTIAPDEVVDGDLNVVFGDAHVAGHVRGDVNTLFGKLRASRTARRSTAKRIASPTTRRARSRRGS